VHAVHGRRVRHLRSRRVKIVALRAFAFELLSGLLCEADAAGLARGHVHSRALPGTIILLAHDNVEKRGV
jgi:hypothetical protein